MAFSHAGVPPLRRRANASPDAIHRPAGVEPVSRATRGAASGQDDSVRGRTGVESSRDTECSARRVELTSGYSTRPGVCTPMACLPTSFWGSAPPPPFPQDRPRTLPSHSFPPTPTPPSSFPPTPVPLGAARPAQLQPCISPCALHLPFTTRHVHPRPPARRRTLSTHLLTTK